ncbi:hypothetical protein COW36_11475 [bacterium (Candidatus Blackallbacteria) CG17_big_fil_post_rev_8_21_14_2_50_48_46]|uniref:B12-binding domain-containing protein n=1 Tax=bacterium (Candidatus Blackallbacteria) CG17_big_fil_post_rev_8_21_14_2_50_48_46 TaxID=2014261 RepID=A0A2M7G4E7_9BACT|nr:MAG: hypothetical protein COW64_21695 [bacterium (Candidatus Blackallbacteria) CG18_big_fil_WC_8_21_14_2_50_49_26]PIW16758.1 MAG: hypothetical protein COW36_11475 [bacterium (Candidatus Blackallbacteria) CG17_big_fil_post_rev_8_21_14_2_50_48_46]PIW49550.1 MAG: hypothetical protein COW20_05395 [bacterium (Candidatus Blackallbacteria) CG13_big_fil_rev_8_21_14_2_50_49_14]
MKLAFFPLFHPSSFDGKGFQGTGIDFMSAYYLTGLLPFLEKHFPDLQTCVEITLPRILLQRPDLVVIWSSTPSFEQVETVAEVIKQNLEIPILLAGPHISHLPTALPAHVDIGILGEPEIPLHQLLGIFSKDLQAGPMKYGKVPGLIYQSRGRIYSGSPAKSIQQIDQLPMPRHSLLHSLPGRSIPLVSVSRGPHSLMGLLTQPPSGRVRFFSPERTVAEIAQIAADYRQLYSKWPVPAEMLAYIFPVYIADELFLAQPERFQAICEGILAQNLHKSVFFMVNAYPSQLNPETCRWLQLINTRKIILTFPSFSTREAPWMPACSAELLTRTLDVCEQYRLGVIGNFLLNPLAETTRREMAHTYWTLWENRRRFDKLKAFYLPPMPGTPLWEQYQQQYKLKAEDLERLPWQQFDPERFTPTVPLVNRTVDAESFASIMKGFQVLAADDGGVPDQEKAPMKQDQAYQMQLQSAKALQKKYLHPGMDVLEVILDESFSLKPYLASDFCDLQQLKVEGGQLKGPAPRPVDLIILRGSLAGLREPQAALVSLSQSLKPDGQMLISLLNAQNIAFILSALNWSLERSSYPYKLLRYYSENTARELIQSAGLKILDLEYTIMNNIQGFRDSVEGLLKRFETFWPLAVSEERLYIMEISMLVKKNRK